MNTLNIEHEKKINQLSEWLLTDIKQVGIKNNLHQAINEYFSDKNLYNKLNDQLYDKIQEIVRLAYLYGVSDHYKILSQ